jgi:threonine-phosphate decarboxylase
MIDFSANLNPLGLPETVRDVIRGFADGVPRYPDPFCRALKKALSVHENIPEEMIVCGNGAADILYRLIFFQKPKRALILAPSFSEYETALRLTDCEIIRYPLQEENDFAIQDDIAESIVSPKNGVDMAFLCNPNNPTGCLTPKALLERIGARCKAGRTLLLIDECFLDFVEDGAALSMKPFLRAGAPVVILKAFTKFYAMAGLRLGYALCAPETAAGIARYGAPWSVSALAQSCGAAALNDPAYAAQTHAIIAPEREYLRAELSGMGFHIFPSAANYLFFKTNFRDLRERLIRRGILIRDCGDYPGLTAGFYRIAVRNHAENAAFAATLRQEITGRG